MRFHAFGYGKDHHVKWFCTEDDVTREELMNRLLALIACRRFHHDGRMRIVRRHGLSPNWGSPGVWDEIASVVGRTSPSDEEAIRFHTDHLSELDTVGMDDLMVLRPDSYVFLGERFSFPHYGIDQRFLLTGDGGGSRIEIDDDVQKGTTMMDATSFYAPQARIFKGNVRSGMRTDEISRALWHWGDEPKYQMALINEMVDGGVNLLELLNGMGTDLILLRQNRDDVCQNEKSALADLRAKIVSGLRKSHDGEISRRSARLVRSILTASNASDEVRATSAITSFFVDAFAPDRPDFCDFGMFVPQADDLSSIEDRAIRMISGIMGVDESEVRKAMSESDGVTCGCGCEGPAVEDPAVEADSTGITPMLQELADVLKAFGIDPSTISSPEELTGVLQEQGKKVAEELAPGIGQLVEALSQIEVTDFVFEVGIKAGEGRILRLNVALGLE